MSKQTALTNKPNLDEIIVYPEIVTHISTTRGTSSDTHRPRHAPTRHYDNGGSNSTLNS